MKIFYSHNGYRCKRKDQIQKALDAFGMANHNSHALKTEPFDALMVEADIIYSFGKVRLAHKKTYNPFKFLGLVGWSGKLHGTLDDYVKRANEAGIRDVMIEFKSNDRECIRAAHLLATRYSKICFVWLFNSGNLSLLFKEEIQLFLMRWQRGSYWDLNIMSAERMYAQNEIISVDLY